MEDSLCAGQYEGCPPNKQLAITGHNGGRNQLHSCLDVNSKQKLNNTNCGKKYLNKSENNTKCGKNSKEKLNNTNCGNKIK